MDTNNRQGPGATTVKAIEHAVADFFGMQKDELHQKTKAREVSVPRKIAMYLMKEMTAASVPEIGRYYGNKRYDNVARSIAKLEEQRRKRGVVDLVIRELVEGTELRAARERKRFANKLRRPM